MIDVTEQSAHELTETPSTLNTLMTVRKPLFVAESMRALTNDSKPRR